jgi:hypothetical protein
MKKIITGITGGALALGLIAGPAAYAQTISKTKVGVLATYTHSTQKATQKISPVKLKEEAKLKEAKLKEEANLKETKLKEEAKLKEAKLKEAIKLKEVQKALIPVNKNGNKVSTNLQSLEKTVASFYATPNTSSKNELGLYNSSLGKLKAYSKQLTSYKKQLDQISKKYGTSTTLTSAYQKVSELQSSIKTEIGILNSFHYGN